MQSYHLMIDLETMDTAANAAIIAIGATLFCVDPRSLPPDLSLEDISVSRFCRTLSFQTARRAGGSVSADTMLWWLCRPEQAARYAHEQGHEASEQALIDAFDAWLRRVCADIELDPHAIKVWAKGPSFDCTILASAYARYSRTVPWAFWMERDVRTLQDIVSDQIPYVPPVKAHDADADADQQAVFVAKWLRYLGCNLMREPLPSPATSGAHTENGDA